MEVEVFKTNVSVAEEASMLIRQIHARFPGYKANFDLEDCDHILRVESGSDKIVAASLITLLRESGFHAEVLPDSIPEVLQF